MNHEPISEKRAELLEALAAEIDSCDLWLALKALVPDKPSPEDEALGAARHIAGTSDCTPA